MLNHERRKEEDRKIHDHYKPIEIKEEELKKRPGKKKLIRDLRFLQEQLAMVTNIEVEKKIKKFKQEHFEWVGKLGKYLAWQLKKKRGKSDKCD